MNIMTDSEVYLKQKQEKIDFINSRLGVILPFLQDKDITEIMCNQDGSIWIESYSKGMEKTNIVLNDNESFGINQVIASFNSKIITEENPIISGSLPSGDRFEGVCKNPTKGHSTFTIRKKPEKIFTLDDYQNMKSLTEYQKNFLIEQIKNKKNILVVGGTGTGKTTLLNGLINELEDSEDRVFIIEEVEELICSVKNKVSYLVTDYVSALDLAKSAMRQRPDRIIMGELRYGHEVEELLKLWNTGHSGGFATTHANGAEEGLERLEELLSEVSEAPRQKLIGRAIDVVVSVIRQKTDDGITIRRINEIIEVVGYDKNEKEYILNKITEEEREVA